VKRGWFCKLNQFILAVSIWPENFENKQWSDLQIGDIEKMIRHLIGLILGLAGGLGVFFFAWGALQYLTAYGNEEKAQKGKNYLLWSTIGLVVIALSAVLVTTLWKTLTKAPPPVKLTP